MNRLGIEVLFTLIMAASTFCYWWDERKEKVADGRREAVPAE